MAKDVSQMVRGLGMAMRLITDLLAEIKQAGGTESMLHSLTRKHGQKNLREVAALIVSFDKKTPKSEIIKCVRSAALANFTDGEFFADRDARLNWGAACEQLDIEKIAFARPNNMFFAEYEPLDDLRSQVDGKNLECGASLTWNGESYILAGIMFANEEQFELGSALEWSNIDYLSLVPARLIDLEQ